MMKEKAFINIIKNTLSSEYIGDDCAYLKDLNLVVTQDNLVEGIHFNRDFMKPYQLGYKSVAVNISDIIASGAKPAYLTIGLSLPNYIDETFIKPFYEGAKNASFGAKIVGGDITGSDKIFISITAIGKTYGRKISSRSNAKIGQKIVICGRHGSSSVGLSLLLGEKFPQLNNDEKDYFINAHRTPQIQINASKLISKNQQNDYAMMDTSDGLADALFAISEASGVKMEIDFDKIIFSESITKIKNYKDFILYGGEDYGLVATVDDPLNLNVVGEVKAGSGVQINYKNHSEIITKDIIENKLYNHFKE